MSLAFLFEGFAIADIVDAFECRDNFFVMRHHNNSGLVVAGHFIEYADDPECAFAVEGGRRLIGHAHRVYEGRAASRR